MGRTPQSARGAGRLDKSRLAFIIAGQAHGRAVRRDASPPQRNPQPNLGGDMTRKSVLPALGRLLGALALALGLAGSFATEALAQQPPLKIGFGMSLTGALAGNGKAA